MPSSVLACRALIRLGTSPLPYALSLIALFPCEAVVRHFPKSTGPFGRHSPLSLPLPCPALPPGETVVQFFHEHSPNVQTLTHENSLAEWIVDLTTEVGGVKGFSWGRLLLAQ